jgi:hypothetical protein
VICVCQIDDGMVREWVQKARAVAESKGYKFAAQPQVEPTEAEAAEPPTWPVDSPYPWHNLHYTT